MHVFITVYCQLRAFMFVIFRSGSSHPHAMHTALKLRHEFGGDLEASSNARVTGRRVQDELRSGQVGSNVLCFQLGVLSLPRHCFVQVVRADSQDLSPMLCLLSCAHSQKQLLCKWHTARARVTFEAVEL